MACLRKIIMIFMTIVLIAINVEVAASSTNKVWASFLKKKDSGVAGNQIPENSTVSAVFPGESAKLACPIPSELYGTKISWIRKRDFLLLSVGESLYTSDERFFVSHSRHSHYQGSRHSQVWFLHIFNVTKKDEGSYECQTSSHPSVSTVAYLNVQSGCSEILGPPERVVAEGSELKLVCSWENSTTNPSFLFWYHGDKMVNYDQEGGFFVITGDKYSSLTVDYVSPSHEGNYTCAPANAIQSSVLVHVISASFTGMARPDGPNSKPNTKENNTSSEKTPNGKTSVRQLGVKSPSSASRPIVYQNIFIIIILLIYL